MKRRFFPLSMIAITTLVLTLWAIPSVRTAPSEPTQYSGQATVLKATVLGVSTELITAGPLPPEGGQDEDSLFSFVVPGLFEANLLHAVTLGIGSQSHSEASVADLKLTPPGHVITADFVMSQALARCRRGGPVVSGKSVILNLVVDGDAITVGTAPNQVVPLPGGGQLIINEQQSNVSGNMGEITVNALHLIIPRKADVIVSSAYADIKCGGPPDGDRDCVHGTGSINGTPSGASAQFAFAAGSISSVPWWGHLMYTDPGSGLQVEGTGNTTYVVVSPMARHFEGPATINGQGGFTYKVDVVDKGPTGSTDTFTITLSNGYSASGKVLNGDITSHMHMK